MKNNRGYSLLELLVVITIIAVVSSLVLQRVQMKEIDADFTTLKINVRAVQEALAVYARASCNEHSNAATTIAALVNVGTLVAENSKNPLTNQDLSIAITWNPNISYTVSTDVGSAQLAASYFNAVDADRISGSTLYWDENLSSAQSDFEINQSFKKMFEGVCN